MPKLLRPRFFKRSKGLGFNYQANTIPDKFTLLLAVDELIQEAVQGAIRAEQQGPSGWIKAKPQPKTNKRFLVNTLRNTVSSNNYHNSRSSQRRSNRTEPPKQEQKSSPTIKKDKSKRKH